MLLTPLEELLSRYKILNSYARSGEYDKWVLTKFKLAKLLNWKPFEKIHIRTYTVPFARDRFNKEVRLDLGQIKSWYKMVYDKTDDHTAKKAIQIIDEFLTEIPQEKKKDVGKKIYKVWKEISAIVSIPLIVSAFTFAQPYLAIVLILGITTALPFGVWFILDRLTLYILKKHWYNISQGKLRIPQLKKQIIRDLKAESDASAI